MARVIRISTGLPDADPVVGGVRLFDRLASKLGTPGESFLYLVPTRRMTRAFLLRMLDTGRDCFIADQAHTLNDFAGECLRRLHPGVHIAGDTERLLMLGGLLSEMKPSALGGEAADFPGLVTSVSETLKQLKHAQVTPQSYIARPGRSAWSAKARALGQVYERYERDLQRLNRVDEPGVFLLLADAQTEDIARAASRPLLVFHGFYDFTPAQLQFVRKLCDCADEAFFILDHQEGCGRIFEPVEQILRAFGEGAEREVRPAPPHLRAGSLAHVARHIFTTPSALRQRIDPEGRICLITAKNRSEEIETIAADIKRIAKEGKTALRRICVTFPDVGEYAALVREIFPRMGIQFNLSHGYRLDRSPVVAAVFKLMEVVQSGYQRERVTELFRFPCVSYIPRGGKGTRISPQMVDRAARAAGVIRGREDWRKKLAERVEALKREAGELEAGRCDPDAVSDSLGRLKGLRREAAETQHVASAVADALDELSALEEDRSLSERCQALRRLMSRFGIAAGISPPEESALPLIEIEKQFLALARFENALEAVARAGEGAGAWAAEPGTRAADAGVAPSTRGEKKYPLQEFIGLLRTVVASEQYQVRTCDDAGVQVLDLLEMRGLEFDHVYVAGMLNGDFPRPPRSSVFFSEAEEKALRLPERRRHDAEQRYHFLRLLCSARQRLVLSYPMSEQGDPTVRSPFLDEALSYFADGLVPRISSGQETFSADRLWRWLGEKLAQPPDEAAPTVSQVVLCESRLRPIARHLRRSLGIEAERVAGRREGPYSGRIRDDAVRQSLLHAFGAQRLFSITQLETYGRCPFRFFCVEALMLQELEVPEEQVTPMSRGGVIHEMLRRFYTERRRSGKARPAPEEVAEALAELKRLAEEEFAKLPFKDLFWQKELERVVKEQGLVDAFVREETGSESRCEPRFFEFAFGSRSRMGEVDTDSREPPLELAEDVRLVGKIDRIEVSDDGKAIVVDYKTGGSSSPGISQMLEGTSYQLPMYMLAVQKLLGLEPVAAEYYRVRDGTECRRELRLANRELEKQGYFKVKGRPAGLVPNEKDERYNRALPEILQQISSLAAQSVQRIRAGDFPLTTLPPNKAGCKHCAFRYVCRLAEAGVEEHEE